MLERVGVGVGLVVGVHHGAQARQVSGCLASEVVLALFAVMIFKKADLLFACLLLRLVLFFEELHLLLKFFQELLYCGLIFSRQLRGAPQILILLNYCAQRIFHQTVCRVINLEGVICASFGSTDIQNRNLGARRLLLALLALPLDVEVLVRALEGPQINRNIVHFFEIPADGFGLSVRNLTEATVVFGLTGVPLALDRRVLLL